jgi:aspartate/tyrosine/aromatic aminotransferase
MDFSYLPTAPIDPIFAVAEEAKAAGPDAINASIGVILDEEGKLLVFPSTKRAAEDWLAKTQGNFGYPPLLGVPEFLNATMELAFGTTENLAASASVGGTGALSLNIKLAKRLGYSTAVISTPAWPNYARLFEGHGLNMKEVPFLKEQDVIVEPLLETLSTTKEPLLVILQTGCHNPTGKEWTMDQWKIVVNALKNSPHLALLDCAYQGLGTGIDDDAAPLRLFHTENVPFLCAWSPSKNHAIYGLRAGLACAFVKGKTVEEICAWYRILSREVHSAAPAMGQHVVAILQQNYAQEWRSDVNALRENLMKKREALQSSFPKWRENLHGYGLFSILPLSRESVYSLKAQNVFLTEDGRVNIAGIPMKRMDEFITKVQSVL